MKPEEPVTGTELGLESMPRAERQRPAPPNESQVTGVIRQHPRSDPHGSTANTPLAALSDIFWFLA